MEQEISPFDRPIPGQSLTGEPKNNPWEQPAKFSDLEDVTKFYVLRVSQDEVMDDFAALAQAGISLKAIVTSLISMGNIRGIHTVDAGMLVAPVLHQYIKSVLTAMNVEVKDDDIDYQKQAEEKELERFQMLAMKYLKDNPANEDPGKELIKEMVEEQPEEEMTPEEKPRGLMAKG